MTSMAKNIELRNIVKSHGKKTILRDISFTAKAGRVTAFLGKNGAGKSSTLRILFGLDYAQSGTATFGGETYCHIVYPLKTVGAVFDGLAGVPSRKVSTQIKMVAKSNGIPSQRVTEVIHLVGLFDKMKSKLGTLSLGEGQRLGLALSLLGDPQYLVLDEPMNGLDPSGMRWLKTLLRNQADAGKTVLLSSHLLSEVEAIADDVVIIDGGKVIRSGTLAEVMENVESLEDLFFSLTEEGEAL